MLARLNLNPEKIALYIALLVAWVAMLGSLYFSEVRHFVPCLWCWYQRILMYPMALLLAIGIVRRDEHLPYYTATLSGLGILASSFHYLLQKTIWFNFLGSGCDPNNPCSTIHINWFGFVTIPFLALIAFILIFAASLYVITSNNYVWEPQERTDFAPVLAIVGAVLLAFLPTVLFTSPTEAAPTDPTAPLVRGNGAALYAQTCAGCHGVGGQGGSGPALVGTQFTETAPDDEWLAMVRAGRGAMPASGGRPDLGDDDIIAILQYLREQP